MVVDEAILSAAVLLISNGLLAGSRPLLGIEIGLLAVAAVCCVSSMTSVSIWDGERICPVTIEVRDRTTGQPIANADVWFYYRESPPSTPYGNMGRTDSAGRAIIDLDIGTSGKETAYRRSQNYWLRFDTMYVAAKGYRHLQIPAPQRVDAESCCLGLASQSVKVDLEPTEGDTAE